MNPFAIAQAALLTAFAAQTMLGNGAWLHTKRLQPAAWCAAVTSCLAVGVLVYCTLTVGIRPRGAAAPVGFSFLAWFVTATVAALIVVTTTCAIYVADGKPYATDYPPADNCGQDSFLLLCMWFVLGWTPQVVFAHVPAGAPERLASIGTILAGFLLLFGPAFLWTLENNDTHVERQRRVREVPAGHGALSALNQAKSSVDRLRTLPARIFELARSIRNPQGRSDADLTQHEFLVRLSGHTAIQNVVALMLAIITIIGIVGVSSGFAPSASGIAALPPVE